MPSYGWKKDKYDPRDFLHPFKLEKIPASYSLKEFLPPVRDQGQVGSCTGFGIGGPLGGIAKQQNLFTEWYSPTWIYNGARFLEGTLNLDVGAVPSDCYSWLFHNGCLLEHFWPYNPSKLDMTAPGTTRMAQAIKYKDFQYFRCVDGVMGICSAIAAGHFVSIGAPFFRVWESNYPEGILPEVTVDDVVAGGHETFAFGYDLGRALLWLQNSWGTGYNLGGLFAMPFSAFDVFKKLGGYDAQYMTFTAIPAPPPPPPVKKCWIFS